MVKTIGWKGLYYDVDTEALVVTPQRKDLSYTVYDKGYAKVVNMLTGDVTGFHRFIYAAYCDMNMGLFGGVVHHIDRERTHNNIENLVLLTKAEHYLVHHEPDSEEAKKILAKAIIKRDRRIAKVNQS